MKVKTKSRVYYVNDCGKGFLSADGEYYHGPDGEVYGPMPKTASGPLPGLGGGSIPGVTTDTLPKPEQKKEKKKIDVNKGLKNVNTGVKEVGGIIDSLKSIFGKGSSGGPAPEAPSPQYPGEKPGMSNGTKVLIGVGITALVVTLIIVATKKRNKS